MPESSLACDLTALDEAQRERHQCVTQQLFTSIQEVKDLADGYALRLPPEASLLLLAAEFITRERLCCPFFDFALKVRREGGPLWLSITGREGVKQFIAMELGLSGAGVNDSTG
jgi:hypothetical protein